MNPAPPAPDLVSETTMAATPRVVVATDSPKSDRTAFYWGLGCWLAGSAVLVHFHFSHTLVKPHYQYILLIPPLVGFLLWQRWDAGVLRFGRPSIWLCSLWTVPLAVLAIASWLFSPWLAMAALVLLGPATALALGGYPLWRTTWGIWLVTVFLLPLPLRMDERLIVQLRDVATVVTSRILDYFGMLHMLSGNVIELPEKKLFVADACSGIHSLFVLMAAAAVVGVWNNRGPIATFVLLVATFGLVMVENVLRLLSVSLSIRFGYDLSEGTGHQILGFVLFAFSLAMILSFDQWIAFMSIRRRNRPRQEQSDGQYRLHSMPFLAFGVLTLILVPIQWIRMPSDLPRLTEGFQAEIKIGDLGRDFLPEEQHGFTLIDFETVVRVPDDPFGHHSQIWRYSRGNAEVMISLNSAYRGLHDACLCYRNTGWNVDQEQIWGTEDSGDFSLTMPAGESWENTPALQANLSHPLEGNAILFYSMLSETGKTGVIVDSRKLGTTGRQATARFQKIQGIQSDAAQQWVQLQMVVLNPGGFSEPQVDQFKAWFREVQAMIFDRCRDELSR